MPMFRSAYGGTYTITGVPVVINDLASQITGSIAGLLIAALLVMAATLLLVFRNRFRLLPLAVALAATGITFGLLAVLGASLTMASIAVLPILIGLGVDYGIQFQARAQEARRIAEREGGAPISAARGGGAGRGALGAGDRHRGPGHRHRLPGAAALTGADGARLRAAAGDGIAVALACALTAGPAVLILGERDGGRLGASCAVPARSSRRSGAAPARSAAIAACAAPVRSWAPRARPRAATGRVGRAAMRPRRRARPACDHAVRRPGRVLALAAVLAVAGWVADTQTGVQSDVTKLVPTSMPALHNLHTLEKVTGVSRRDRRHRARQDVATPATVEWMISYEKQLLSHYGYVETKGCSASTLCPALSLPDLFSTASRSSTHLTQAQINASWPRCRPTSPRR